MDSIDALRSRAEQAGRQLSEDGGHRLRLFERLSDRINVVADDLRDKQKLIDDERARGARLAHENEQLRNILQSLLLAIEADPSHGLVPAIRSMEERVSGLVVDPTVAVTEDAPAVDEITDTDTAVADMPPDTGAIVMPAPPADENPDDDLLVADESDPAVAGDPVRELNAIGDIVQRLMTEMGDADTVDGDLEVEETDLNA